MAQTHEVKYEDALKRLEKLVSELDRSELDLETRLKKFEEGTKLARACQEKLAEAEVTISQLEKTAGGEFKLKPFEKEDDN